MSAPILALEDHSDAYFAWKRLEIRQAHCWHIDAHLDVGRDGLHEERLKSLQPCANAAEAQPWKGNAYLPWGGLHCGNYLYPAIREGLVGRLTWVVPPDLVEGGLLSWAQAHLNGWFDLTLEEFASLKLVEQRVEGTVLGIPLCVATADNAPPPQEPVLLDIDLDYYLTQEGEVWQQPEPWPVESLCTTVAFSVLGGYLPTEHRCLGKAFLGDDVAGYEARPIDRAAGLVRMHRYAEALPLLKELRAEHPLLVGYLSGSCHHHLEQSEQALECWAGLLEHDTLPEDGRAYLRGLCSEILLKLGRPAEALAQAELALKDFGPDYRLYWAAAQAQEQLGNLRKATKMVRRGLNLAESYVFGLQMRLGLARLYRAQDKRGLARLELARLEKEDVTGQLRPQILLLY